ncbi:AT hook domain-containing protein [Diplocarpon rosae]|nr:AT hook domain-containing protein [Diplocarpon rosae]
MAIRDVADQYFTLDARIASFQSAQKRRASREITKGGKPGKWPHKFLSGDELAKAGFFFYPQQANPDNAACFLCYTALDGWEEGDDPLSEHLKHSPDCGWAIVAAIEKQDGELSREYPSSSKMIEARKATFADKWPHEGKKGWKCKVKQMVDAGWKYTPTPEYDDMATCTYCALALDGWENSDKPMDEHFKRSPDCPFFVLNHEHLKNSAPKQTKLKRERTSKASRLSTQSAFIATSEIPEDLPAEEDDSILTTATNATTKRMGRAKKAPATKGRKTKIKKSEPIEVVEATEPEDDKVDAQVGEAPIATRNRKRKSEEKLLGSNDLAQPPSKRRATRTRGSTAVDDSIISHDEVPLEQPKPGSRRGRPSRNISTASVELMRASVPDDDEIDRALEADLERHVTENEGEPSPMPIPKKTRASRLVKNRSMFDAAPIDIDEATIDAELKAMEIDFKPLPKAKGAKVRQPRKVSAKQKAAEKRVAHMAVEAAEYQAEEENLAKEDASQHIPTEYEHSISIQHSSPAFQQKKQRASARLAPKKASTRATRSSVFSVGGNTGSVADEVPDHQGEEPGNETEASITSQSTVVQARAIRRGSAVKKGKGGKKGPGGDIEEIVHEHLELALGFENPQPVLSAKGKRSLHVEEISVVEETYYNSVPEIPEVVPKGAEDELDPDSAKVKGTRPRGKPRKISVPESSPEAETNPGLGEPVPEEVFTHHDLTPKTDSSPIRSSTPPTKNMTASQSPQSSDAENHPPSSKPSALAQRTSTPNSSQPRIPLSEATPAMSPSKRNVIAGLKSNQPWSMVDLDAIFLKSPSKNTPLTDIFGGAVQKIKDGELTSPEKRMTVEEWIQHNATMAEKRLRSECERIVGVFESEGTRAMQALEGVECLE